MKMISVCIDLVLFIEVHVPSQENDQCVYRSCPLYWSRSMHTLITFLDRYIYVNKKGKIDTHTDHFPGLVHVLMSFSLKYMYPARKGISVCIDLDLFIEVHVPSEESDQCVYRSCPFYWSICIHTDHFPGLVHVLQNKRQDRYTHWSLSWLGTCASIKRARSMHTLIILCTKRGKWSVCVSILPFLLKYMYQARKMISVCIDLALFIEAHVPSQESDQCVYRSCVHVLQ
jgi:hypothetical protein